MIDGVVMKGKCIIMPCLLQTQVLQQLHSNHMGTEKTQMLTREVMYCININADIEQTVVQCSTCLECQNTQPCEAVLHYDI